MIAFRRPQAQPAPTPSGGGQDELRRGGASRKWPGPNQANDGRRRRAAERTRSWAKWCHWISTTAGPVPGFEASASDCLNHALSIARSLNHAVLSSDHLMLALTMDRKRATVAQSGRRHRRLREAAMRRLGTDARPIAAGDPSQTSDLADIRKAARAAAAEREQLVAISDLVNAFPRENDRLTYGATRRYAEPSLWWRRSRRAGAARLRCGDANRGCGSGSDAGSAPDGSEIARAT